MDRVSCVFEYVRACSFFVFLLLSVGDVDLILSSKQSDGGGKYASGSGTE